MESATVDPDITSPRQTDPDTSPIMIVVFCVILAVLGLASVLGNVVVLGTLRHAWATVGAKPGVVYGKWHVVDLSMAHFFFLILLSGASNMLLCVIAINRYAVVSKPNTSEKVGRRRAKNLSIYAWSHALAAAVISIIIWGVLEKTESVYLNNDNRDLHQQIPPFASQIVSYTLVVAAPMATMTVTYMRLFRRVKMRIRAVGAKRCNLPNTVSQMASQSVVQDGPSVFGAVKPHNMILARPTKQNRRHADLRTAVTLLILLSIFVLCWTPIMVLSLVVSFGSLRDNNSSPIYLTVAAAVVFIIPACNPLVYSMRNAQFRAAACDFLCATGRWMTTPCRRKGRQSEEPVVDN